LARLHSDRCSKAARRCAISTVVAPNVYATRLRAHTTHRDVERPRDRRAAWHWPHVSKHNSNILPHISSDMCICTKPTTTDIFRLFGRAAGIGGVLDIGIGGLSGGGGGGGAIDSGALLKDRFGSGAMSSAQRAALTCTAAHVGVVGRRSRTAASIHRTSASTLYNNIGVSKCYCLAAKRVTVGASTRVIGRRRCAKSLRQCFARRLIHCHRQWCQTIFVCRILQSKGKFSKNRCRDNEWSTLKPLLLLSPTKLRH
jgi:hypothetical protein